MKYLFLILALLPGAATAARFDVVANVEFVVTHNPAVFGTADGDWISLEGVTAAGTCGTAPNPSGAQRVVFRVPDAMNKAFDVALAAQVNGFRLQVSVDDALVDGGGYCIIRWITARPQGIRSANEKALPVVKQVE